MPGFWEEVTLPWQEPLWGPYDEAFYRRHAAGDLWMAEMEGGGE